MTLSCWLVPEALGIALLLVPVVGSDIMVEKLMGGNVGLAYPHSSRHYQHRPGHVWRGRADHCRGLGRAQVWLEAQGSVAAIKADQETAAGENKIFTRK
jgi:hypothetical protein